MFCSFLRSWKWFLLLLFMLPRLPNHCKDSLRSLTRWHSLREPTTVRSRQSGAPSDEGLGTKQQQITAVIVTPPKTRRRKERTTRKKGMRRGGGRNKKRESISRAQCHPHTPACPPHSAFSPSQLSSSSGQVDEPMVLITLAVPGLAAYNWHRSPRAKLCIPPVLCHSTRKGFSCHRHDA